MQDLNLENFKTYFVLKSSDKTPSKRFITPGSTSKISPNDKFTYLIHRKSSMPAPLKFKEINPSIIPPLGQNSMEYSSKSQEHIYPASTKNSPSRSPSKLLDPVYLDQRERLLNDIMIAKGTPTNQVRLVENLRKMNLKLARGKSQSKHHRLEERKYALDTDLSLHIPDLGVSVPMKKKLVLPNKNFSKEKGGELNSTKESIFKPENDMKDLRGWVDDNERLEDLPLFRDHSHLQPISRPSDNSAMNNPEAKSAKITELYASLDLKQFELERTISRVKTLEDEVTDLQNKLSRSERRLLESEEIINKLVKDNNILRNECDRLKSDRTKSINQEISELNEKIKGYVLNTDLLKMNFAELQKQNLNLKKEIIYKEIAPSILSNKCTGPEKSKHLYKLGKMILPTDENILHTKKVLRQISDEFKIAQSFKENPKNSLLMLDNFIKSKGQELIVIEDKDISHLFTHLLFTGDLFNEMVSLSLPPEFFHEAGSNDKIISVIKVSAAEAYAVYREDVQVLGIYPQLGYINFSVSNVKINGGIKSIQESMADQIVNLVFGCRAMCSCKKCSTVRKTLKITYKNILNYLFISDDSFDHEHNKDYKTEKLPKEIKQLDCKHSYFPPLGFYSFALKVRSKYLTDGKIDNKWLDVPTWATGYLCMNLGKTPEERKIIQQNTVGNIVLDGKLISQHVNFAELNTYTFEIEKGSKKLRYILIFQCRVNPEAIEILDDKPVICPDMKGFKWKIKDSCDIRPYKITFKEVDESYEFQHIQDCILCNDFKSNY